MKMLTGPNGRLSTNRLITLYCFLILIPCFIAACIWWPDLKDLAGWIFGSSAAAAGGKAIGDVVGTKTAVDAPPDEHPPVRETLPPIPEDPIANPPNEGEPPPIFRKGAAAPSPSMAKPIDKVGSVVVMRRDDGRLAFVAGLQIDADGSPRAYHPRGKGLDYLANAGKPGNWWGIATDSKGQPYVQGADDPAPGFYVSTTALQRTGFPKSDPRRYIDSETVPYFVLPLDRYKKWGVKLGAEALVTNLANGKSCTAILADLGPKGKLGEGSIALARALGVPSDPKTGGAGGQIHFLI